MIDSIYVATSGMLGNERALNVISNNVANLNTPGFHGSSVSFANIFSGAPQNGDPNDSFVAQQSSGGGVDASRTMLDTQQGAQQQTGKPLDLFLQGEGFFVLQDANGATRYTREGSFSFNSDHVLVANDASTGQTLKVMSQDANGNLVPIDLTGLGTSASKPTTELTFNNDLSPNDTDYSINSVTVYDKNGTAHTLKIEFVKDTTTQGSQPGETVSWTVNVFEGTENIGTSDVAFSDQSVTPGFSPLSVTLALQNAGLTDISFNFDQVSGSALGSPGQNNNPPTSTMAVASQDGLAQGTPTAETFDSKGVLQVTYSNGQTATGAQLVFAQIADQSNLVQLGHSLLAYQGAKPVVLRKAAADLQVVANSLEGSNVDLTTEFSTLILMQRGYQGSSQVVSTANDMLQQLLSIRGSR